jgi:hypothetical protein
VLAVLTLAAAACGGGDSGSEGCAHVIGVSIAEVGTNVYSVAATIESADTGWEKYADRFEVRAGDGTVLGGLVLTHPHEDEQPFTRTVAEVTIPAGTDGVVVAAHDSEGGFCGNGFSIAVPGR